MESVLNTKDLATIQATILKINELEAQRELIIKRQKDIENGKVSTPTPAPANLAEECKETCQAYKDRITELAAELAQTTLLTDQMADSLADIDPNTENGDEGKAFIKKMWKLRDM